MRPGSAPRTADDVDACDEAIAQFEETGFLPRFYDRDAVVRHIHRRGIDAMLLHNYSEADHMNRVHLRFLAAIADADRAEAQAKRDYAIDIRISSTKDETMTATQQWRTRLASVAAARDKKLKELNAAHKRELREFEERYNRVESFRKYTKPSPGLLQMRARERSMVMCNRYPEAKAMQREAIAVEAAETEAKQQIAETETLRKKELLLAKQAQEFQGATQYYEKLIRQTHLEMDKALLSVTRRIDALEVLKKLPARDSKNKVPGLDPPDPFGLPSPRTRDSYYKFRLAHPGRKLRLAPLCDLATKCPIPIEPETVLYSRRRTIRK
jgi:hypothetical protein